MRRPRAPAALIAVLVLVGVARAAPAPNVVLIMTDDQGYGDLGCTGNPVLATPGIDRLAAEGSRLAAFHVSPVCAPTRASLFTGRYSYRTRAIDTYVGRAMMDPTEVTVAEVLGEAGYATGLFGKWHLGDCYPMRPQDQGFQETLVHRGGGIGQPSDPPGGEGRYTDAVLFANGERRETEGYCTDVFFDAALAFIEGAAAAERPFLATITTNAPHGPFHDVPREHHERLRQLDLTELMVRPPQDPEQRSRAQDRLARILAMIANIDDNVGRLLDHLDELELTANTIVCFMVDNGPNSRRYVGEMRGMKSEVHDGGIRSPFLCRWPGRVPAGGSSTTIAAHIDVMPTLLAACGVPVPAGLHLDGISMLPELLGRELEPQELARRDRALVIQSHRGDAPVARHHFALRTQEWKLVHPTGFGRQHLPEGIPYELYAIAEDPGETTDLAGEHPELVTELLAAYDRWFADVSSTRPDNYAPPVIQIGTPHEHPTVLTRQDWRHERGRPWGQASIGHWQVSLTPRPAPYRITLRLRRPQPNTVARLEVGTHTLVAPLDPEATEHTFELLHPPTGTQALRATLESPNRQTAPWQVVVSW